MSAVSGTSTKLAAGRCMKKCSTNDFRSIWDSSWPCEPKIHLLDNSLIFCPATGFGSVINGTAGVPLSVSSMKNRALSVTYNFKGDMCATRLPSAH